MSESYVGEIRPFAGNFAPVGWALCDGSLLQISNNETLYTLIGTTYGGSGLSPYTIGQQVGTENVTLSVAQMANHAHSFSGTATAGNTATPSTSVVLAASTAGFPIYDGTATPVALSPKAVTTAGGSMPHNNRQPFLAISYIISLYGIYPAQS